MAQARTVNMYDNVSRELEQKENSQELTRDETSKGLKTYRLMSMLND